MEEILHHLASYKYCNHWDIGCNWGVQDFLHPQSYVEPADAEAFSLSIALHEPLFKLLKGGYIGDFYGGLL